ncbi:MAG: hypothetical protein ACREAK_09500 [Nitrosarchaeum sp.]
MNKLLPRFFSNIKDSIYLKATPPAIIGSMLFLIPIVGGDSYTQYAGLKLIEQLQNLVAIIALTGAYLVYIFIFFKKDFDGYWHWKKRTRLFHKLSFISIAIISAIIPYLAATIGFFFNAMDNEYGFLTLDHKIALGIYLGFFSFLSTDMFSGLLGKGFFFRIPKINRTPMKKYSILETKIRKHLPSKINDILSKYD